MVSASIPGTDPSAGELMIVSHLFERPPTPGGSDNCTGVAVTLEIGRTLAELIRRGELPQPKRTIRFLWVPEISGLPGIHVSRIPSSKTGSSPP